jgi:hypothetical protein
MFSDWWADFKTWTRHPFATDMDALHWFYFIGLLLIIGAAWGLILRAMKPN